ncbi:MAG: hypothetical protein MK085_03815 [Phycisphaerales bacterium]|nr:hypothetical protein [Phycisphaerales bacterium]
MFLVPRTRWHARSLVAVLVVCATATATSASEDGRDAAPGATTVLTHRGDEIDPSAFFDRLLERYRRITGYVEETDIQQETSDPVTGDPPIRVHSRVRAEIVDGRLEVERPGLLDDAVRTVAGEEFEPASGASAADLWLLPHMHLRFTDDVLQDFREGVEDGFAPAEADMVSVDDRELVRLELRSGEGLGEPGEATIELFVDPDRMLVERVNSQQMLASGLEHRSIVRIEPVHVRGEMPDEVAEDPDADLQQRADDPGQPRG